MVLMEKGRIQMDTTDKVKKLQDTIRKLQLQNEQLRAQQFAKNGLIGTQVCDSSKETDTDPEIIPLNEIDLSDEQTWLYIPAKASASDPKIDIVAWLRRKAEGNNNVVKEPSNLLSERLMPVDHGDKQSIDTRTFTRPKKRIGVLSSLTSSSMPENLKREEKRVGGHDELSAMLQSAGLPIKGVLDSILQKHRKNPVVAADTVISTEDKLMKNGATNNKLNSTFVFQEKTVNVRQIPSPRRIGGLGSAGMKGSCPALDQTFEMPAPVKQASPLIRGRREMGSSPVLDSTFTLGKGSSPHSEEDCLSTTSDGSLSSSSRPMNVDDVQQMARLQEESKYY
ncbi:hypothetical protein J437_LFUL012983 [Ladona fulva]|uniref:Uncharacterized protein n=1 Tax=Ladona fulva TaxID=123851 RepID=A0A8K0P4C4_LADFU|nr:hypothetical protein J437_LFUL012983 [Ladona fulva]